jgi:cytochrome b561
MRERWPNTSVALHWLAAALIVGLATAGFVMTDLPPDSTGRLLISRLHTLGGTALMLLTVVRLVARRRGPAVTPLPVSELHRRGVGVIHALLYAVTFAIGASGFVTGARSAWPDYLRGQLAEAPALEALASRGAHELLVFALLGLVLLHVGGVMLQQVRTGGVLRRMVPFLGGESPIRERDAR